MNFNYVCFDIGNVLCRVNFNNFLASISKYMNIAQKDAFYFLHRTQKLHDLGLTNLRDELHDHFDLHSEVIITEIMNHWDMSVWKEDIMFQLLDDLIDSGVKVALLSNIGFEHVEYLNANLANLKGWKDSIHFFSCAAGARKPSVLYYQSFLMQYPKFRGAAYFDDVQENLDAGKTFGFKTVRFSLDDLAGKNEQITQQNIKTAAQQLKNLILKDK